MAQPFNILPVPQNIKLLDGEGLKYGASHELSLEEAKKVRQFTSSDFEKRLIDLPSLKNPGEWSERYKDRIIEAKELIIEYPERANALNYKESRKNRYHWEVFTTLNNFQVTAPHILLPLRNCDTDNKNQLREALPYLNRTLSEFHNAWEELKKAYSITRFIEYPDNYVPDRYYHFASQHEGLSWMVQAEELFMQKIKEWMDNH